MLELIRPTRASQALSCSGDGAPEYLLYTSWSVACLASSWYLMADSASAAIYPLARVREQICPLGSYIKPTEGDVVSIPWSRSHMRDP